MKYTVIDFETANSKRSSACAIGIVVVEDNQVVEEKAFLIKPSDMKFDHMNIGIHGIYPEDVINEPYFDEIYHMHLKEYLDNQLVIAHNASFDMSVLRASLKEYDIEFPIIDYLCTVKIAQKVWPDLHRHSLDVVSKFLKFTFKHHDAFDDARACANIMKHACSIVHNDPMETAKSLNIKVGKVYPGGYSPCSSRK